VAQGPIAIGGFLAARAVQVVRPSKKSSDGGTMSNGAIVEREIPAQL